MINEIAPRPHNSGHHTIEACETSQFENHLRAILNLPLGSTTLRVPSTAMLNLIGTNDSMQPIDQAVSVAYGVPGASVHLYGKTECRKGRKMGHITVTGDSDAQVRERIRPILQAMQDLDEAWLQPVAPAPPAASHSHPQPLVGIIMGSDSDLPTMLPAARILDKFEIPYELTIISAHRTPARMVEYAHAAAARGLRVIIAGAGGAAHLPGMVASETTLPVVGVPVKASVLDGVDSLYSIVQMPVSTLASLRSFGADVLIARNPRRDRRHRQLYQRRPARRSYHRRIIAGDGSRPSHLCGRPGKGGSCQGRQVGGSGMGRVCRQGVEEVAAMSLVIVRIYNKIGTVREMHGTAFWVYLGITESMKLRGIQKRERHKEG